MNTLNSATINRNRDHEAALITFVLAAMFGLGFATTLLPTAALIGLGALPVFALAAHRIARVLRWRREDCEDARVAAAWRAANSGPARALQGVS